MNDYIDNLDNLIWRLNAGNARTAFTNALEAIKLCRSINLDRADVCVRQADDHAREADNARKAAIDLHECDSIILSATVATAAARAAKEYIDTMYCHHLYATPTTGRPDYYRNHETLIHAQKTCNEADKAVDFAYQTRAVQNVDDEQSKTRTDAAVLAANLVQRVFVSQLGNWSTRIV
ncbi:hypothetical protein AGMMS49950_09830 [Endomicrobiia bacterium]|nr:hypothetical protein AGMMS49950_09830 [Endomicrobiia bacterium]